MEHLFCNALVRVIYSRVHVSGQCSHTIVMLFSHNYIGNGSSSYFHTLWTIFSYFMDHTFILYGPYFHTLWTILSCFMQHCSCWVLYMPMLLCPVHNFITTGQILKWFRHNEITAVVLYQCSCIVPPAAKSRSRRHNTLVSNFRVFYCIPLIVQYRSYHSIFMKLDQTMHLLKDIQGHWTKVKATVGKYRKLSPCLYLLI